MIHCLLFRTSVYCSWYLTQLQYPAVLHMSLQPHVKPNSKLENTFKYKAPSCGRMCSIQKKLKRENITFKFKLKCYIKHANKTVTSMLLISYHMITPLKIIINQ